MHPQLQLVADEFAAAQERLHTLAVSMPEEWWAKRADPARWSVGECVAHLNLTAEAYLSLRSALALQPVLLPHDPAPSPASSHLAGQAGAGETAPQAVS
jgi:hypothetical protein